MGWMPCCDGQIGQEGCLNLCHMLSLFVFEIMSDELQGEVEEDLLMFHFKEVEIR